MIKSMSMNKITLYNILSTVVLQGISLFTSPLFSRLLGPTNYGIVSIYNTWVSLISITFGLQTQSTIAIARSEFSKDEQEKYQSSILSLSILSYFIFSVLVIILIVPLSSIMQVEQAMIVLMLLHGFGQFCINFANLKFTYEFKANLNFYMSLIVSISSIVLSLILISMLSEDSNYWGRILGNCFVYFSFGLIIACCIQSKGKMFYSHVYWSFCLPLAIPIIFHNLSGLILNQSDRVMLQQLGSLSNVGIYSLAYSFGSVISTIWNALNNSWVPFYYEFTNKKKKNDITAHTKNYCEVFTVICIGFMLLTPEVYKIFASKEYWNGVRLIPIFVVGFYFIFLYSFPVNYEFYCKKTKVIAIGTTFSAVLNIILNFVLIQKDGIYGAAFATLISYALQYFFHLISVRVIEKKQSVKYPYGKNAFLIPTLIVCICSIVCYSIDGTFIYARWIIGGVLGCVELYRLLKRKAVF